MVRLALESGRADGLNISHIVSSLSHHAGIPGHSLGKIQMENQISFVDVPEKLASQVLAAGASYRVGKRKVRIRRA